MRKNVFRMMDEIDQFLDAIEVAFKGMSLRTAWPLNAAQICSYFDVDEALDIYYRIKELRKTKSVKEIAELMPPPDVMRLFLEENAIVGLKLATKLKINNVSVEDRVEYVRFLFQILKEKMKGDMFCLDGKNLLLDQDEVGQLLKKTHWEHPHHFEEKKKIANLTVTANNVCYTLFLDIFMAGGFYIHGPYDASELFGEGAILVVRDYYDLDPRELWPEIEMPHKKMRILAVYRNIKFEIDFANHPMTHESIGPKLIGYKVFVDDKAIKMNEIESLTSKFHEVISSQTKKVNAMSKLDQVRKGAEIAYYLFRGLRGESWKPPFKENPSSDHWRKLFDPRNEYI